MRRLAWIAWGLLALIASLLVVPGFVNWEAHKPAIARLLGESLGRAVRLDGPLEIAVLPQPAVIVRQLRVANVAGAPTPDMLDAERVVATLSWAALLRGRLGVAELILERPRLALERGTDGTPGWAFPVLQAAEHGAAAGLPALSIDRLAIVHGEIAVGAALLGRPVAARAIDLAGTLDLAAARLQLAGTAVLNDVATTLSADLRLAAGDRPPLAVRLGLPGGRLDVSGWPPLHAGDAPLHGHVAVEAESLPEFSAALAALAGQGKVRLNETLGRRLSLAGDVALVDGQVALDGLALTIGEERITGALRIALGGTPAIEGRLVASRLDADRWLRRLQAGPLLVAGDGAAAEDEGPGLPLLRLTCEVAELRYRQDTVRDLTVSFAFADRTFSLKELRAVLPGEMRVHRKVGFAGDAEHPGYDGAIEVDGRDLRRTLKWIGIDTAAVPPDRLRVLRLEGRTRPAADHIRLTEATLQLDDQTGAATAEVAYAIPTVITASVHLASLNLDAYALAAGALDGLAADPAASSDPEAAPPPPPVIDISAAVDRVIFRGEAARGVEARVVIRGNALRLKHVGVDELASGHLELSGAIADFGTAPRFDLAWRAILRDTDRMLDYAGLPRFRHGRIGAAQVAGRAVGTLREATLSDLSVAMLDSSIRAEGRLAFGDAYGFDFRRFGLTTPEAGALLAAASGGRPRPVGALEMTGRLQGDLQRVDFRGDIALDGMPLSGELASTLSAHPHVRAVLQAPAGLRLDRWLPAPGGGGSDIGRAGADEIDLSPLRGVDADLELDAAELAWGGRALTGMTLAGTLRGGVLEIGHLSGTIEGAHLSLAGTIDARAATPAITLGGEVADIDVSHSIAVAGVANRFGSDDLAVALEGTVTVGDLRLRAEGGSVAALLASAVGRGRIAGRVRPNVVAGSRSLASFATGIGRLFSTQMGFAAEVLGSFVDTWVTTRGDVAVANGSLTISEHTVQSPGATAFVATRVDLLQGTIDSRIALDVGTTGVLDYVMSVHGPLESPVLEVVPR
ncbi:MAG: AsmA family protein [Reyranellaceae bacterium]